MFNGKKIKELEDRIKSIETMMKVLHLNKTLATLEALVPKKKLGRPFGSKNKRRRLKVKSV